MIPFRLRGHGVCSSAHILSSFLPLTLPPPFFTPSSLSRPLPFRFCVQKHILDELVDRSPDVSFDDIIGLDGAKQVHLFCV